MKKIFLLVIVSLLFITACKTTEANYRAAYEIAKEHKQNTSATENTIYNRYRDRRKSSAFVIGQARDTVHITTEAVSVLKDEGFPSDSLMRYNVVVGGFKQVFNAKAMRDRLAGMNYRAFVVNTREPLYYTVAVTSDSLELIYDRMVWLQNDSTLPMRDGYPFILQPLHLAY